MMRIANAPGSIISNQNIQEDAASFAKTIMGEFQ
jgi:hypothetical protein